MKHFYIKYHLSFIWTFIGWCYSILLNLLYGRKLRKVLLGLLSEASSDTYAYKLLAKEDVQSIGTFFANQPQEAYTFFNPHKFDEKSLIKKNKDSAFVMIRTYSAEKLVGKRNQICGGKNARLYWFVDSP